MVLVQLWNSRGWGLLLSSRADWTVGGLTAVSCAVCNLQTQTSLLSLLHLSLLLHCLPFIKYPIHGVQIV